ncbi:MmgE/PrpD family protein [Ostreiculturibacter nitratireducens]|uniref:MmgE/PrpD family protein n=1 Tax=Ostreiculturibacter nitratireducens TaxID=3075226 RepID=UPI0031B587D2
MKFNDFLHGLRFGDIPEPVIERTRYLLLDLIGVAAAGTTTDMSRIIRDHAAGMFGPGSRRTRLMFDGRAVSPAGAALAGGISIDSMDGHDGHKLTKGHAGCGVLPSVLAYFDAEGLSDEREFLTQMAIGYEVATRAGIALHRTACDYHTSGAWVAIAAAALGARTLGLGEAATREAIGIAEYHGPRSQMMRCIDYPTMVKDGSGWGAMAGVSAAYLAASGFTGAPAITVEAPDVADLWGDLGSTWRVMEQYIKCFPVCRWAQPPLQAVLNLRAAHGLSSDQVERIEVETFHQSVRLACRSPKTTEEAQYSTSFPTAAGMVRGRVGTEEVSEAAFSDPEILRLSEGMVFTERDDFNAAFPARRLAEVTLVLKDGRRLASGVTEARGDPEAPLPAEEMVEKYRGLAEPVLGAERSGRLEAAVLGLGISSGADRGVASLLSDVFEPLLEGE